MPEITKIFANQSLSQEFVCWLEFHLSRTLANSLIEDIKWFWCDGIALPEMDVITLQLLNKEHAVQANAWLGEDGQRRYQMVIYFGPAALAALVQGASLQEFVPGEDEPDWFDVDIDNAIIELYLD